MIKKYISGSLRQKLLVPTTLVLSISIITLSIILVTVQQKQLTKLSDSVLSSIGEIIKEAGNSFGLIEKEMNSYLRQMSTTASETLASSTQAALEAEQTSIGSDLEKTLRDNADAIGDLIAEVSPGAILLNNFVDLIAYAKSATRNPDVVYAVFIRPNEKPMTRYVDKENPIIQKYIESGEGNKTIDKVLNASQQDESVFIVEKQILLEGQALGKLLLCVDKSSVNRKIDQISGRFSNLINDNSQQIHEVLYTESTKITNQIRLMLEEVNIKNKETADNIANAIRTSSDGVKSKTQFVSTVVGGASIIVVFIILFFILVRISNSIRKMVNNLKLNSENVTMSSNQISMTSQSLAEGSSEQAATIEETSSSLEEMSSMTQQNAENANQANSLMKEADRIVGDANTSMSQLTLSMDEISNASKETSNIIKTIDEIAFQTNLLALNAAVEAARAGEAGAGFAVVADEVRNLAIRAAEAAKNTANLIEDTVKKSGEGGMLVERTNKSFTEVVASTSKVVDILDEIAAASNEQAQGIEQINKAVTEIDKVTQQNAANAEEVSVSSEEMTSQSKKMKTMVNELLTLVGGNKNGKGRKLSKKSKSPEPDSHEIQTPPPQEEVGPDRLIPFDDKELDRF